MRQASSPERSGPYCRDLDHVAGIQPVYGWSLMFLEEEDADGFWRDSYAAERDGKIVFLDVSRFSFEPMQDRFAWLVRNGFPRRPTPFGGWSDAEIDGRIASEREALAA
jgi:hypothetical protein